MGFKVYLEITLTLSPTLFILNGNHFWNLQFHSYSHPSSRAFFVF
ncbi:hypothetical protein LEP1GSC037_0407 [Leptospira interrogans str. 2006001854]|uniref:Uncharacterized protein n=1 Tax=Leptospira interrogans str. 2006001854 TaxID=1001590 RepID=M6GER6_LEPIR|nr:hypothetical protein LEP1GSC037_0407 [Leptospira interrogans str. 2006001854]